MTLERPSFNPALDENDIKQRFYRYFQEEATGTYVSMESEEMLTLP